MTRKNKTEKDNSKVEDDMKNGGQQLNQAEVTQKSPNAPEEKEESADSTEVKQISGEEPGKLEYYSKEHLIEKVDNLNEKLKDQTAQLKKLKEETENWKNKYMRLQAEFENAQKRWDKTRKNLRVEYTASVLKTFLPLYDSFKKALSDDKENLKILKGFYDQFMSILKSHKAEPMEVKEDETFDYSTQEALTSIEKSKVPKNTILEVIQDGWKLDKEVLRYAKVIISKEPKPPEPEPETKAENDVESVEKEKDEETERGETEVSAKDKTSEKSSKSKKEKKKQ